MEAVTQREAPEPVEAVKDRLSVYFDVDSRRKGLALKTQPEDVILSDAQKSGTTWIRQVQETQGSASSPGTFLAVLPFMITEE